MNGVYSRVGLYDELNDLFPVEERKRAGEEGGGKGVPRVRRAREAKLVSGIVEGELETGVGEARSFKLGWEEGRTAVRERKELEWLKLPVLGS